MKRFILLVLLFAAACKPADHTRAEPSKTPNSGGPPPIPPYQTRAQLPGGDRLAAGHDGAALFSNRCGICHLAGGMGTNLLTKQMILTKRPPTDGLLANRTDLTSDYVKSVVRMGKNAMPRQTRVDVTDAELDAVAHYLGKADK
jgi:mono/diheme cytochrome c family protein